MTDIQFIDGLSFKEPHPNAPDFVKAKGSIRVEALREFLASADGEWVNFDLKVSKGGKWYAQVDDWKPDADRGAAQPATADTDDIPF